MLPAGFSNGSGIVIGKSIGQERPNLAMQYYRVAQLAAIVITAFQIMLLAVFKNQIISGFTSDLLVKDNIFAAWPVLLIFTLFDTTQSMGMSVIRGTGR